MGCESATPEAYSLLSEGSRLDRPPRAVQPRAQVESPNPVAEPPSSSCLIITTKLPLELFAEILLYTASPRDVLSVARCCKFFCATLLNPSSSFIWKGVRQAYPVPLPDPFSTFTEASYAAFMFDGGPCEYCKEVTDTFYQSFAIRLRLCRNSECTKKFIDEGGLVTPGRRNTILSMQDPPSTSPETKAVQDVLPSIESNTCLRPHRYWQYLYRIFRSGDWTCELAKATSNLDEYVNNNKSKATFVAEFAKFCRTLHEWKQLYRAIFASNKLANEKFAETIASKYGWNHWDLLNCTPYGTLHRLKTKRLENVTQEDYDRVATVIDKVLIELAETRTRRAQELAHQKNREQVARQFNRIRSQQSHVIVPPLSSFRQLPTLAVVQSMSSATQIESFEPGSWVLKRLEGELGTWKEKAREGLSATLGYPNWKTASTKILHPVDRVTARFLCKRCFKLPVRYRDDGCYDFGGACLHQCPLSKKEKRAKIPWTAEIFVKDEKAIAALQKLLGLCGVDAVLPEAAATIEALKATIVCTTCEAGLLLDSKSVVGHSHRHPEMQMKVISQAEANRLRKDPLRHGVVRRLTCPGQPSHVLRGKKSYGCQHCAIVKAARGKHIETVHDKSSEDQEKPGKNAKSLRPAQANKKSILSGRLTFDGLRSHLKAKHGIEDIRDEDLFLYNPAILEPPRS